MAALGNHTRKTSETGRSGTEGRKGRREENVGSFSHTRVLRSLKQREGNHRITETPSSSVVSELQPSRSVRRKSTALLLAWGSISQPSIRPVHSEHISDAGYFTHYQTPQALKSLMHLASKSTSEAGKGCSFIHKSKDASER